MIASVSPTTTNYHLGGTTSSSSPSMIVVADLPIQNGNSGLYNGGSTPPSYYSSPTINGAPGGAGAGGMIVIQPSEYEQFLAFQEWQRQRKAQQYNSPQQQQPPTPPSPQPQQQQAFTYASPSPAYDRLRAMDNTMDDPQAPPTPILQLPPRRLNNRALPPRMPPQKYVTSPSQHQQQQYQQYQPQTPVTVSPATPTTSATTAATPVTTNTTTHQSSTNASSSHHHHQQQQAFCNPLGTLFVWYVYLQNHAVQVKSFVDQAYHLVSIFKKDGLACQG
jgi:hypothetical protein